LKEQDKKVYFITGGGTGGHIYPAISIARELKNDQNNKIYYIGNPNNLEAKIAADEGFDFLPINVSYMPRKLNLNFVQWAIKLQFAIWKALFYTYKYKPNAVFGTGGYVSAPTIIAAMITNTPYMIHDSDAHPGIVSRYVSQGAKIVSVAFEEAKKFIKNNNIKVFGNPIKQDFFSISKEDAKKDLSLDSSKTLLIMGGSQGAMTINSALANCLKSLTQELGINVILQTGNKNYNATVEKIKEIYPEYESNKKLIIRPYFDNMAIPLKASDIAIARAGSLSLSELAAVEIPSILVPYPYAAADHQRKNARCFEQAGAALYIEDAEINANIIKETIENLIKNDKKLENMKNAIRQFCKPNATKEITQALKEITK